MRINLSRIVLSPSLNSQTFKVYRSSGSFVGGRWIESIQSPPYFEIKGIVTPSSEKELKQIPEGDQIVGAMTFYTSEPLLTTHKDTNSGVSDKVEFDGELYKIISLLPWKNYGFYVSVGERIKGD